MLYCASFILVVYLQLSINTCYKMNDAVRQSLLTPNPTVLNLTNGSFIDFTQIYVADDYWSWLD